MYNFPENVDPLERKCYDDADAYTLGMYYRRVCIHDFEHFMIVESENV